MQDPDGFNALDDRRKWRRITALVLWGMIAMWATAIWAATA